MNLYSTLPISSSQHSFSTAFILNGSQLQLGASGFMLKLYMVIRRRRKEFKKTKTRSFEEHLQMLL